MTLPREFKASKFDSRTSGATLARGSRQRVASCGRSDDASLTVSGKGEAGLDVLGGEVGKILSHLCYGHVAAQVIKHVGNSNAGAVNARLSAADERINRDALPL